jgi:eukaryotic-like serine/threonine-protein kinase
VPALLIGAALALGLALVLLRLPWWVSGLGLLVGVGVAGFAVALGSLERALGAVLIALLALALLAPAGRYVPRASKVAPRRSPARRPERKLEEDEIPGYELLEKVGVGGMASVYRARRQSDGRIVALKIPMEQYGADAKFARRFHREAEVAQRLDHVNIVRTFEHGQVGSRHYMAMEFVDGRSLESYIDADELEVKASIEIMQRAALALKYIHAAGIVHRDIKPANIMIIRGAMRPGEEPVVAPEGVKLMDFGIAGGKVLSRLTLTGARVGTPVYMSPEQARGLRIDHKSDIYSLGLVFYEMLTGQTAFKGGYEAIVHQQVFQTPTPPRQLNVQVPKAIDSLVMQMIAKEPENRPGLDDVLDVLTRPDLFEHARPEPSSRLIVTVSARHGVVRVFDSAGHLQASFGDVGVGKDNLAAAPLAVAADGRGHLYAVIFEYRVGKDAQKIIHKLGPGGEKLLAFGAYGGGEGELLQPVSLAVGLDGELHVLDAEAHRVLRFSADGGYLGCFGGRGLFSDPRSLSVGPDGSVYVLDYGNKQVQRFGSDGAFKSRWAFKLGADQEGMRLLDGLGVDDVGNVYISDASSRKVRRIASDGKISASYIVNPLQGEGGDALLDLGVDEIGCLYAARRGGHLIRKYDTSGRLLATFETHAAIVQMIVEVRR